MKQTAKMISVQKHHRGYRTEEGTTFIFVWSDTETENRMTKKKET